MRSQNSLMNFRRDIEALESRIARLERQAPVPPVKKEQPTAPAGVVLTQLEKDCIINTLEDERAALITMLDDVDSSATVILTTNNISLIEQILNKLKQL